LEATVPSDCVELEIETTQGWLELDGGDSGVQLLAEAENAAVIFSVTALPVVTTGDSLDD
jgi:hypothetical protein